ncbi:U3 small nucleolar ribonucleoprotein-like protein Mpp10 [Plenodomus tracheiphilus IPT5]|uniref:U3 small nucleolar ribonucleoprotein protein MPP10 n=1 Tax=Plenodomus tracheiphilus IPT5 TaxID=1408161 RepID=A0A6A7AVC2_9PLEO|nr:U3 small nucleolar ribonucleoprotein-like protein Mpp10 [Plenodomus tracheiphilus IPT5]
MAPPSFSPDTSISSRTLSVGSAHPPLMELPPTSTDPAASLLNKPLAFLQPTTQLNASFLAAAKRYLDPVAAGVSESQTLRQQDLRKKRKRGGGYDDDIRVLHLKKVHLDGFGVNQVFEQTRKIVEAATDEIELSLPEEDEDGIVAVHDGDEDIEGPEQVEEYHTDSSIGEEGVDWEYDGVDDGDESGDEEASEGAISGDEDLEMDNDIGGMFSDEDRSDDEPAETYVPDPNGLNDGFFSIDDFNKRTDFLEQQDQRGEAAESDDEEIDWTTDPMSGKGKARNGADDMDDDESDEGGPTFGNADLNAPEGDSDDDEEFEEGDLDGMDDGMNANNIMYADFYAPPAKKVGKNKKKRGRPNPHNFPEKQAEIEAVTEEDVEGTMARVHRDLFEDDDDVESNGDLSDLDPSDPKSRRSTHERRQAKLAEEIRKLEAANVAKREWQLSGEARAADRPLNSLLEENLEFERAGKPVPIITAEVSEDIEALIKRRIIAGEFDEVIRRRPDDLATGPARRGRFELDDTKSGKGLAEMYEEDLLRETDPNYVDAKDEKLKKEHDEISGLWKSLSAKLDSLSSSHFKPKPAAPNLEIRVDAPAIEMEDARPTAGGEVAGASMLAPQEVYKPGEEKSKTEVVTSAGMPIAREEMTKEEKLRRRRRAKEKAKKAGLNKPKDQKVEKKEQKKTEKKQLLGDLKKGGVQVIGRKGALTDVEGKEVSNAAKKGAGSYKL